MNDSTFRPTSLLRRAASQIAVLAVLGATAYFGHRTDWKFGWWSEGDRAVTLHDRRMDYVAVVHAHPQILAESAEWCPRHGVAHCPLCHPELAQLDKPTTISPEELARVEKALAMQPQADNDERCPLVHHHLRFDSAEAVDRLGIEIAVAWTAEMTDAIAASGETAFDPTRIAHLTARGTGPAWRVMKRLGESVAKGELLALIEAAEVAKAKAEFLQALVNRRLKATIHLNIQQAPVSETQKREALAAFRDADTRLLSTEQTLVNFGLPLRASDFYNSDVELEDVARQIHRLGLPEELQKSSDDVLPGSLLPMRAPQDGTITQCDVIAGDVVSTSRKLFTIADGRHLQLTLNVSATEAALVKIGQTIRFRADGAAREVESRVQWIGSAADEKTRTVPIRAELANPDGRIRAAALGVGRIVLREEPAAVVVPHDVVQSDGNCRLVFVRDKDFLKPTGPKVFHVRTVRVGARDQTNTEIIVGVLAGEIVAARGSAVLLNELRRHQNSRTAVATRNAAKH